MGSRSGCAMEVMAVATKICHYIGSRLCAPGRRVVRMVPHLNHGDSWDNTKKLGCPSRHLNRNNCQRDIFCGQHGVFIGRWSEPHTVRTFLRAAPRIRCVCHTRERPSDLCGVRRSFQRKHQSADHYREVPVGGISSVSAYQVNPLDI